MRDSDLDLFLSLGYFRMQQEVFTCRYVVFDDKFYAVHWLRIDLATVHYGPKQSRLFRINGNYSVAVNPLMITHELETLYARYRNSLDFDAPDSVESCLLGGAAYNAFTTSMIEVRDGDALIAVGIFDNGLRTIAGIMNFYHPDYRKQSLGKYLMLLKINYAQSQQKAYYYPGYLVSDYPKFDYKLFPCEAATEVFDDRSGHWLPFSWETVSTLTTERANERQPGY